LCAIVSIRSAKSCQLASSFFVGFLPFRSFSPVPEGICAGFAGFDVVFVEADFAFFEVDEEGARVILTILMNQGVRRDPDQGHGQTSLIAMAGC